MDENEQPEGGPRKRKAGGRATTPGPDRRTRIANKRKELQQWEEGSGDDKSRWIQRELDQMFASGTTGKAGDEPGKAPAEGGKRKGKETREFDLPRARRDGEGGYSPRAGREGDSDYKPRTRRDGEGGYSPRAGREGDTDNKPRARRDGVG